MNKKKIGILTMLCLFGLIISSQYTSANINKIIETDFEYDVNVGDSFVFERTELSNITSLNEVNIDEDSNYVKFDILNTTVNSNGIEANFTYNETEWNTDYKFDEDFIDNSTYWETPSETKMSVNSSLSSFFTELSPCLPNDFTVEDIASGDLIDIIIYQITGQNGRDGIKDEIETYLMLDDSDVDDGTVIDTDGEYGRVCYTLSISGTNSSLLITADMKMKFSIDFKLNKYGILEKTDFKMTQDVNIYNTTTKEVYEQGESLIQMEQHIVWASESKYITEDKVPYWEKGPSWISENWMWILLVSACIIALSFGTWFITMKTNCSKLDPSTEKPWVCK